MLGSGNDVGTTANEGGRKARAQRIAAKKMRAARGEGTSAQSKATAALTSAATCDWGSSHALRRLAGDVLRPASRGSSSIDVDGATSAYWNRAWRVDDQPSVFLDGSPGNDTLDIKDWKQNAIAFGDLLGLGEPGMRESDLGTPTFGSAFENPPGIGGGDIVKQCWANLDYLIERRVICSLVWVGFNFDQMRSLIPNPGVPLASGKVRGVKNWTLHPLHASVTTIIPGGRIAYLAHPQSMIDIYTARLASPKCGKADRKRVLAWRKALKDRLAAGDDSPVAGPSPTHASYVTIVWHEHADIRRMQMLSLRRFLAEETLDPRSPFRTCALVGRSLDFADGGPS